MSILNINNLTVQIEAPQGRVQPVDEISFSIEKGKTLALVGESGCGKSMTALAIMRLLPPNASLCQGSEIYLEDKTLTALPEIDMRKIRGKQVGMIFQDPSLALNPVLTIQEQLLESILAHKKTSKTAAIERIESLLRDVKIPNPTRCRKSYPHQLSGGMKQRIMIAMAIIHEPVLLIADEPTTALDATTQLEILNLLKKLISEKNMALLLITHDLGVVRKMADRVAVMYAGHLVETASCQDFFQNPKHPYSQKLMAAIPSFEKRKYLLSTIPGEVPLLNQDFSHCRFKNRCPVAFATCEQKAPPFYLDNGAQVRCFWYEEGKNMPDFTEENIEISREPAEDQPPILNLQALNSTYHLPQGLFRRQKLFKAVQNVTLTCQEGETLAIVGESGSGKSTLAKTLLRLMPADSGRIMLEGEDWLSLSGKALKNKRADLQMIFQDPFSAMDPHMQVEEIIEEGLKALKIGSDKQEQSERVSEHLRQVGLSDYYRNRYIHELSGGQRQRVAIARALAVGAKILVCDEPTSALDVSVQAQVLNLLKSLQEELALTLVFITHNMGVVGYLADHVVVMKTSRIVEMGPVAEVLHNPQHAYTQQLLKAVLH